MGLLAFPKVAHRIATRAPIASRAASLLAAAPVWPRTPWLVPALHNSVSYKEYNCHTRSVAQEWLFAQEYLQRGANQYRETDLVKGCPQQIQRGSMKEDLQAGTHPGRTLPACVARLRDNGKPFGAQASTASEQNMWIVCSTIGCFTHPLVRDLQICTAKSKHEASAASGHIDPKLYKQRCDIVSPASTKALHSPLAIPGRKNASASPSRTTSVRVFKLRIAVARNALLPAWPARASASASFRNREVR
jgi:hypothetical protein